MREVSPERVMDLDTFGVNSLGYEMFRKRPQDSLRTSTPTRWFTLSR